MGAPAIRTARPAHAAVPGEGASLTRYSVSNSASISRLAHTLFVDGAGRCGSNSRRNGLQKQEACSWLESRMSGARWGEGVRKGELVTARDEDGLHRLIELYVPEGRYRSLDDVL